MRLTEVTLPILGSGWVEMGMTDEEEKDKDPADLIAENVTMLYSAILAAVRGEQS